jgi:hypothetical protein
MGTWAEATKARGNRTFLPAGTNNYNLVSVRQEQHPHFGNTQAVLDVELNGDRYNVEIPLSASEKADPEIIANIIASTMGSIGAKPQVIANMEAAGQNTDAVENSVAWGPELYAALTGLVGSVVELHVIHKDSKKMRDDGTPFVNATTYVNRVVKRAEPGAVQVAAEPASAGFDSDDDIPFMWDGGHDVQRHHNHH